MASSKPLPPGSPFGYREPSERDVGALGRELLTAARDTVSSWRTAALVMLVPGLLFYVAFAAGMQAVFWALRVHPGPAATVALITGSFLLLALLGQHYRSQMTLESLAAGYGTIHRVLLAQALIVKAITGLFFALPYAVVRNLGRLIPRTPRVDARVLSLSTQLAAALDEPVTVRELEGLLPRTPPEVIDEGVLLLRLAGMVEVASYEGTATLLPTTRLRNAVAALPQSPAGITRISDLRRPPTSPATR